MNNGFDADIVILYNGDFYFIAPQFTILVQYQMTDIKQLLPPDVSNRELGLHTLIALETSAKLNLEGKSPESNSDKWTSDILEQYKYKTKRKMFLFMKCCSLKRRDRILDISPLHHEKIECWGRKKSDGIRNVHIPLDSSPEIVGKAVRRAFARCTGLGAD